MLREQWVLCDNSLRPTHQVFYALTGRVAARPKFKITYTVILAVSVFMMHHFISKERPAKFLFHDKAVLIDIPLGAAPRLYRNVPIVKNAATFPQASSCLLRSQTTARLTFPFTESSPADYGCSSTIAQAVPVPMTVITVRWTNHRQPAKLVTLQVQSSYTPARLNTTALKMSSASGGSTATFAYARPDRSAIVSYVRERDYLQSAKNFSGKIAAWHKSSTSSTSGASGVQTDAVKRYVTEDTTGTSLVGGKSIARLHSVNQPRHSRVSRRSAA